MSQHDRGELYREFQEQKECSEEGWYEVSLPWKDNHSLFSKINKGVYIVLRI